MSLLHVLHLKLYSGKIQTNCSCHVNVVEYEVQYVDFKEFKSVQE